MVLQGLLSPALLLAFGCSHRHPASIASYKIEGTAGAALLAPSLPERGDREEFNSTMVRLAGEQKGNDLSFRNLCTVQTRLFSLLPYASFRSTGQWILRSRSVQGWAKYDGVSDVQAEWSGFVKELLVQEERGCFGRGQSLSSVRRLLAERMTFPAGEALLFYGFSDTGFVDLQPGMQVGLERPVQAQSGRQGRSTMPLEARSKVVALGGTGVALRRERARQTQFPGTDSEALLGVSRSLQRQALAPGIFAIHRK